MEGIVRKPYEISLWDDDLVFRVNYKNNDGQIIATKEYFGSLDNFEAIEGTTTEIIQHYKERKICIIGSDTMNTPIRATAGKLVSNVNGSNTLTFNLYSKYYDEENDAFYDNPFLKLLINERKVKLRYGVPGSDDVKWYDFIIKDVKENSENKTFSYTCKDLFINELSKSGFSIQLDPELENNMGNIATLAETILEESDWRLGENNDILSQTKEEPLYEIKLKSPITVKEMQNKSNIVQIAAGKTIYGFYSIIKNQEPYFQFLYREDEKYQIDDDHVIINTPNYFIEDVNYINELPWFAASAVVSVDYRGDKLVRQALTRFDSTTNRYVNVYKKNETEYYGYEKIEYITPTAVSNYFTNGEGFSSDNGWDTGAYWKDDKGSEVEYPKMDLIAFPDPRDINSADWADIDNYRSFIRFKRTHNDQTLMNSGFADHRSSIKTLAKDEEFVFRAKLSQAKTINSAGRPTEMQELANGISVGIKIAEYTLDHGKYIINNDKIYFSGTLSSKQDGWYYANANKKIKSLVSKSYTDLINARIGIFFEVPLNTEIYFENVQFFRYVEYERLKDDSETEYETVIAEPGGELFSSARTKYIYYLPNENYTSEDDIVPAYEGYTNDATYIKQYNDNQFEKVRSITASESNRFNMIQELCEIFECWAKFEIDHNMQTGEILLDENFQQRKWITFHEYIGRDNYAGFRYGVNLKSIQRTLNSDGIVSKIVVKNNANEFAPNGFCSISRATENPIGENFIYDFDYYIQQGLIGFEEVNNDLYMEINGYLGYYTKLRRINKDREARIDLQTKLLTDISQYKANYQTYKLSVDAAQEELSTTEKAIYNLTGYYLPDLRAIYNGTKTVSDKDKESVMSWWEDNELLTKVNKVAQLNSLIRQHTILRDQELQVNSDNVPIGGRLYEAEQEYGEINEYIEELATQKRALNLQFYKKYSRFIQEGSWMSEDYVDENLYYLDAESTLYTSAQPKVTYTINVLELSQLEGYENYHFALGDKTYIEDTEFFGWVWKNGLKTPYHEEIVITEFTVELDSPEKNTFKVQNFKTQFEDLFQRITATTQSVEYHTGEYGRAASVIESNGTIAVDTLQNSFANNAIRLENAKDQSVVWDETGITTTSLSNPSEVVRIVSGGIFMSVDGGITWNTGITGAGMNANFLTTGQINTSSVNIISGGFPSFRWDEKGISAFEFSIDDRGVPYGFNSAKFVRYDQYGLYGIDGYTGFAPKNEQEIWNNAKFALTWKGFLLRNQYHTGYVSIDSDNDFVVSDGTNSRIQIGNINPDQNLKYTNPQYGIRIANDRGETVMQTDDSGELWLENRLRVGTESTSTVEIGYLSQTRKVIDEHGVTTDTNIHEVIHAGDSGSEFIVYEDGKMVAEGAEFHGTIYAEAGLIGGMTIGQVEDAVNNMESIAEAARKLDISSKMGYNFKVEGDKISPEFITLEASLTGFIAHEPVKWWGSKNFESWEKIGEGEEFTFTYADFTSWETTNATYYIKAMVTSEEGQEYESWVTIMSISSGSKGEKGEDALTLVITSSVGNYFRNNTGETTLTARLFKAGQEIDTVAPYDYTYTWTRSLDDDWSFVGKSLKVTANDVDFSRTYICNIS